MSTRTLTPAERASEIERIRNSSETFADAVTGLARLTHGDLEDFVDETPPSPPLPPTRAEILERELVLEKARRERGLEDYLTGLWKRAENSGQVLNPFSAPAVRQIQRLADRNSPGYAQEIAQALLADGSIDREEFDAASELIEDVRRGAGTTASEEQQGLPSGHPIVSQIIAMASGDPDLALRLVSDLDFHVCERLLKTPDMEDNDE